MSLARFSFGRRAECGPLGSRSVAVHLLRGVIATTLLAWAVVNHATHPALAIGGLAVAVVAMRGCPMCWTVGLFETLAGRMKS